MERCCNLQRERERETDTECFCVCFENVGKRKIKALWMVLVNDGLEPAVK